MPISIKQFEKGDFRIKPVYRSNHSIAVFLRKHGKEAFTVREICKNTKMKEETVRSMLANLKKEGLVRHKTPYFAYKKK